MTVTPSLDSWSRYAKDDWPTLLLGNGFSMNLWAGFSYTSLYDKASFAAPAEDLFTELKTTNFEQVLECIHHARLTEEALGRSTRLTERLYKEVRDELFSEVSNSHVPWTSITKPVFDAVAKGVRAYERVFTTNYDLTLYWSLLQGLRTDEWADLFWNQGRVFDPNNVDLFDPRVTAVYYLHGAIHLWQRQDGTCGKWTSAKSRLLDVLQNYTAASTKQPLFVSEGNSRRKLASIRRSEYLSFCLRELEDDDANTVVFGHGLGREDEHILVALNNGPKRRIAVSMYPVQRPKKLQAQKARIVAALPRQKVLFFNSRTHPLGDSNLRVP